ncbi:NmrA/HSCARG family protein [Mycobacterium sp. 050134]|uniref:NmrA/HSCARG family protein n=1 Tax=Mycobacterium sp. 050134 TaxID=3096111 RepID=UPI002EDBA689
MDVDGPILVTGATGAQGGAVVDALLAQGAEVRALVRNPSSASAAALAEAGVELVKGDFDDGDSLAEAASGAVGVFSVQMATSPKDLDGELRTGKLLIDAARRAGVGIFVHTSVARAGEERNFVGWDEKRWWPPYWEGKSAVNQAVKAAGFPHWVILKPAFMMDNFIPPKAAWLFPSLARGEIATALQSETRMDLIAAADVGRFAAAAFDDPKRWDRQEIDLAAVSLTMDEVASSISKATGRTVTARALPPEEAITAGNSALVTGSQEWANVEGYRVDLDRARSHGLTLESFAEWADRHRLDFELGGP